MHNVSYSHCKRKLIKSHKGVIYKSLVTVFNAKKTAMCRRKVITSNPVVCNFCICFDCKIKLCGDKVDDFNSKPKRSRRRKN